MINRPATHGNPDSPISCEQIGEHRQNIIALELTLDMDRQALSAVLIDHGQHPERLPIMRAVGDEVVAPDMPPILRSQPDARSVIQPETAAFGLLLRYLQPLATPDTLDPLGVHSPAFPLQQCGNPAIAIATILRCQPDDVCRQAFLIGSWPRRLALGRTVLADHSACATLGHTERRTHMINASTAPRRA